MYKTIQDLVKEKEVEGAIVDTVQKTIEGTFIDDMLHARFDDNSPRSDIGTYSKRNFINNENKKQNYI